MTAEVFLGRQPMVDVDRQIFGYELLYRGGPDSATIFDDPDAATRGVMERVLLQWGMEHVVGDRFGMINASASLVVHGLHRAMPPEGMIIEVREETPFDDDTIDALQQARYDGYHFALDNVSRLGDLERSQLLPLASIVKIELTTTHDAEIPRTDRRCPRTIAWHSGGGREGRIDRRLQTVCRARLRSVPGVLHRETRAAPTPRSPGRDPVGGRPARLARRSRSRDRRRCVGVDHGE